MYAFNFKTLATHITQNISEKMSTFIILENAPIKTKKNFKMVTFRVIVLKLLIGRGAESSLRDCKGKMKGGIG